MKIIIVSIVVITGVIVISRPVLYLYGECAVYFHKNAFLAKNELEDFSQFNSVSIFIRGVDREKNPIIMINAPNLVNDSSKVGLYVVILDRKSYQIIETKWTLTEYHVDADTAKLQQLAQKFMQYEIPRLNVDEQGNVFVYLKDIETLALVRFTNESELQKQSKETKWINIKGNWYKPR